MYKKTSNRLKPTVEKKLRYCTVVSNEYIRLHRRLNIKKFPQSVCVTEE